MVVNIHTIKPIDEELLVQAARITGEVLTIEGPQVTGGFGSAVCESLSRHFPAPVLRIGVSDRFGGSGQPRELLKEHELDGPATFLQSRSFLDE